MRTKATRAGDVLLVQGPEAQIQSMKAEKSLLVLDATEDLPRARKAKRALIATAAVVALAATGLMPIATASLLGALAMRNESPSAVVLCSSARRSSRRFVSSLRIFPNGRSLASWIGRPFSTAGTHAATAKIPRRVAFT